MSARTLQVITRQILAFPVDGGVVIAERFAATNIEVDEVRNVTCTPTRFLVYRS